MTPLDHIMAIHDIKKTCGPVNLGRYCLLFNIDKISKDEAIRILETDGYSPYVLVLAEEQWAGLFLNKDMRKDGDHETPQVDKTP